MHFLSQRRLDDALTERAFRLGDLTGILWTPSSSDSAPLVLLGQPGGIGLRRMRSRLEVRARSCAAQGFASLAIELPGAGDRPRLPGAEQAHRDLVRSLSDGERPSEDVIDRLILPLVDAAVPEWRLAIDEALALPEIGDRVAISGGVIAVAVRLAATDPRIVAAALFAGSFVPRATMAEARGVTVPLHMLLQWDDEGNDRQSALDLFDAFGSAEKTLCANLGGHTGVPAFAGEEAARFLARHLRAGARADGPA